MAASNRYAQDTEVPVERSKAQLEAMLRAHGAEGFASAWTKQEDRVEFVWGGTRIRFVLPRPSEKDFASTASGLLRKADSVKRRMAQQERQRWRALFLVVRAKLEAVESGLAVFEEEFLAFVVGPGDRTIGERLVPLVRAGELTAGLKQLTRGDK